MWCELILLFVEFSCPNPDIGGLIHLYICFCNVYLHRLACASSIHLSLRRIDVWRRSLLLGFVSALFTTYSPFCSGIPVMLIFIV